MGRGGLRGSHTTIEPPEGAPSRGCSPAHLPKGERCGILADDLKESEAAASADAPWLALGVLMPPVLPSERRFRAAFNITMPNLVAWRFVVAAGWYKGTAPRGDLSLVVQTPCPDGEAAKQVACFCKTTWWFRRALALFPSAAFIGKIEDDTVIHLSQLLRELRRSLPTAPDGMLWFGHFQWAVHWGVHGSVTRRLKGISSEGGLEGEWCVDGDRLLTGGTPTSCGRERHNGTVAPFASGAIDVRSRKLAAYMDACTLLWLKQWDGAACDGQQGFFVAQCAPLGAVLVLTHLPSLKMRSWKTNKNTPTVHSTVVHNVKNYGRSIDWRPATPALAPLNYEVSFERRGAATRAVWSAQAPELSRLFQMRCIERTCFNQRVCWPGEFPQLCA